MRSLTIGNGEIGSSLHRLFQISQNHISHIRDLDDLVVEDVEVLNIAYPYSPTFVEDTQAYIKQYKPKVVIIHSTVPVGTTRKVGLIAVHSPVNGRHPHLQASLSTFIKFLGGNDPYQVYIAAQFLNQAGISTTVFSNSETTELAKLRCTLRYGVSIIEMKETEDLCRKYNVPFHEVYTRWNTHYNEGYTKLNEVRFIRPNLSPMPGPIGGHCVVPNCDLQPSTLASLVKKESKKYGRKKL